MGIFDNAFDAFRARRWNPVWLSALSLLAVCWAVIAVALPYLRLVGSRACLYCVFGCCVVLGVCLFAIWRGRIRFIAVGLCGCALGLLLAFSAAFQLHSAMSLVEETSVGAYVFTAVEDAQVGDYGTTCTAQLRLAHGREIRVKLYLPDDVNVHCWDKIHATCQLAAPTDRNAERLWKKGIAATANLENLRCEHASGLLGSIEALRIRSSHVLDETAARYPACQDGVTLIKALLLADRGDLFSSDKYAMFKKVGLAHLVAVSGAHLVLISGFFASLLQFLRIPKRVRLPLQCAFIASYAVFTGMPVSVLRAAAMSVCSLTAFYAHRSQSSVNSLAVCLVVMIALRPFLALSVSLALSAFASLGIILLARSFQAWILAAFGGHGRSVAESLGVCLAANFATLPLSIPLFSQLPLVSPVSNLVAALAFPMLVCLGIAGILMALVVPQCAALLLKLLAAASQVFVEVCMHLARIPLACIPATGNVAVLLAFAVLIGLVFLKLKPEPNPFVARSFAGGSGLLLAVMIGFAPLCCGTQIIALDVGQGDAILLRSGGKAMLIDTGTEDSKLLAALARHRVHSLDAVIISHPDDDHCGSLEALKSVVAIKRVCVARSLLDCNDSNCQALVESIGDIPIVPLYQGDELSLACYTIRVLGPEEFVDAGGNVDSLELDIEADIDGDDRCDWRMFSSGDAETDVLDVLAKAGVLDDVDILKVSHHGSKKSLDEAVLDELKPEVALISVGEDNRYGHPTQVCLDYLEEYGCAVYRTDESGDVVCNLRTDRLRVSTQR